MSENHIGDGMVRPLVLPGPIDLVKAGDFGKMVALRGNKIVPVDLAEATKGIKQVDDSLYAIAEVFFG